MILSGGPRASTTETRRASMLHLLDLGRPVLGICYGMGLLSQLDGGRVAARRSPRVRPGRALDRRRLGSLRGARQGRRRARVDEPRRPHGVDARGFDGDRPQRELADRGLSRPRTAPLRRAVPPGGRAHAARRANPPELPVPGLRLQSRLDDGGLRRARGGDAPRAGRAGPGHLRAVGRGRFVGGGGARAARDRRSSDLHLRRQRPSCARTSSSEVTGMLPRALRLRPEGGRCARSLLEAATRASRIPSRSARSSARLSSRSSRRRRARFPTSSSSPKARSIPTSSNRCPSRGRRRRSRATTTSAACPSGCICRSSSRCASCSRTRCGRSGGVLGIPEAILASPAIPRPGSGHPRARRGDCRAPRRSARGRRDRARGDRRPPVSTPRLAVRSPYCCRCRPSA